MFSNRLRSKNGPLRGGACRWEQWEWIENFAQPTALTQFYEISCSLYNSGQQAGTNSPKRGYASNTVTKYLFDNLDDNSFSSYKDDLPFNRVYNSNENSAHSLLNHSPLYRPGYFGSQSFLSSWFADLDKESSTYIFSPPEMDMSKSSSNLSLLNCSSPESYIVRVVLDHSLQPDGYETVYKCVKLENSDKTRTLVLKAMSKHNISGDPNDYCISQLLPDGGIDVTTFLLHFCKVAKVLSKV
ncbi:unnamed protein product [Soboliphyme baturini]|uniref:Ras-associating domain-containing protein n=1 Tax=Soboliphyme baturini TaxID=241478 RepID=A0A183J2U2_9BILA|nr:unnamed protein product [Soboliphyme baturini]